MRRFCIALLLSGACALVAAPALAGVNINVGIGVPLAAPVIAVPAGPAMVVIPGTPVYYAPGLSADMFFYQGFWWTPYNGGWYRASTYNGPWAYMAAPPVVFGHLPPHYREMARKERHIPYREFQAHWRDREHQGGRDQGGNWGQQGGHDYQRQDHRGPGRHEGRGHGKR